MKQEIPEEHKELFMRMGNNLKDLRKSRKLGYVETAKLIGVSKHTLYEMEQGEINFQIVTLLKVLDFYQVELVEFLRTAVSNSEVN